MTIFEQLIRADQAVRAQQQANQLQRFQEFRLQQAMQQAPLQQRLMELSAQSQQFNLQNAEANATVQRAIQLGSLARGARGLSGPDLANYLENARPVLQKIAPQLADISPEQISQDTLQDLDVIGRGLRSMQGNKVQQAEYVEGLGFIQQLRDGTVSFEELPEEIKRKIQNATKLTADLKAEEAAKIATRRLGAESDVKFKDLLTDNATTARRELPKYERLLQGVRRVGTGKFQDAKAAFGELIPGVDPSDEQALNAALNEQILESLAQFKGALSDSEREFARTTRANLGNTTRANLLILERLRQGAINRIDELEQYNKHLKEGGARDTFQFVPRQGFDPNAPQPRAQQRQTQGSETPASNQVTIDIDIEGNPLQ